MNNLTTTDRLKDLLPQLFSQKQREGNYYLRLQLTESVNILLDLTYVQESLTIDHSQITAVPNLPEYVVGLMNSRNQVFLAVDLAHLAGFPPATLNQREYQTVVVQNASKQNNIQSDEFNLYGLTVRRIQGISRILPENFEASIAEAPENISDFIQGSILESHQDTEEPQRSFLIDLARLLSNKI
ncbi:MAG: chemotaxis protein CheW [Cyanobacteria bacterium J06600_6]